MDYNNKTFKVEIKCFVCDAPARDLLKDIIGHTGYHSCNRCVVHVVKTVQFSICL